MSRLAPGTAAYLNDCCPWPERRGLLAIVMPTDGAEHEYPVHGLGRNEYVIHISEDPLKHPSEHMLANGVPWSCVITRDALTPLADAEGDLRPHLKHWETESSSSPQGETQ